MVEKLGALSVPLKICISFKEKLTLFSLQTYVYVYIRVNEWREWLFIFLGEGNE